METRKRELVPMQGGDSGEKWNPRANEKNNMRYNEGDPNNSREGYVIESKTMTGQDGEFDLYIIHRADENGNLYERFSVIGDTVLGERLENAINQYGLGVYVVINYKGRAHKKGFDKSFNWTQTNSYHVWDVLVDTGAPKYDKSKASVPAGNPASTQNTAQVITGTEKQSKNPAVIKSNDTMSAKIVDPHGDLPF